MSNLYRRLIRPAAFALDAETAHEFGIESLRLGLGSEFAQRMVARRFGCDALPKIERFGLTFANPLGMAAGFDKNGIVVNQLAALGFGFVEVGTVTLNPQKGNEKPRLFRLTEDRALINRLGFNNEGAAAVARRLKRVRRRCIVGVNIGRNKDVPNEEAVENYLAALDLIHDVADYIAVNISSPNTPNLRDLQRGEKLEELLGALIDRNRVLSMGSSAEFSTTPSAPTTPAFGHPSSGRRGVPAATPPIQEGSLHTPPEGGRKNEKPLFVKIAPDLTASEIDEIVDTCMRLRVSGIIATNTTVARNGLRSQDIDAIGAGGLSGRPLLARSNEVIRSIYRHSNGQLPIIGVGGIFTPEDAFEKIAAGACLVQAYTGFIYKGPAFARDINRGLLKILEDRGFASVDSAVGCHA